MYYILKISTKAFVIESKDLIITSDYTKATKFNTIGDAMKSAIRINEMLDNNIIKIESIG